MRRRPAPQYRCLPVSRGIVLRSLAAITLLTCSLPLTGSAETDVSPASPRSSNPQVVEVTDRLLTALEYLLDHGALPAQALSALNERYAGGSVAEALRISDLVPAHAAVTAELWAARRLLGLYDDLPVEREVVMRWIAEVLTRHGQDRDTVKRPSASVLSMDFVSVEPGRMKWRGQTVEIKEAFEVQATPILTEHWDELGRPATGTTRGYVYERQLGRPVAFWMANVPELLAALNAHDPNSRCEYALMSQQQWLYLANGGGQAMGPRWGKKAKGLLDYAWLKENRQQAGIGSLAAPPTGHPHPVGPTYGRRPHSIDGQPIWGLFGNMYQLVVPPAGLRQAGPSVNLVGGRVFTSCQEFESRAFWTNTRWAMGRGAVRLVRRPKRAGSGKTP